MVSMQPYPVSKKRSKGFKSTCIKEGSTHVRAIIVGSLQQIES